MCLLDALQGGKTHHVHKRNNRLSNRTTNLLIITPDLKTPMSDIIVDIISQDVDAVLRPDNGNNIPHTCRIIVHWDSHNDVHRQNTFIQIYIYICVPFFTIQVIILSSEFTLIHAVKI